MILKGPHHTCILNYQGHELVLFGESHGNPKMCDNGESIVKFMDGCDKTQVYLEMPVNYKLVDRNVACDYTSSNVLNAIRTCLLIKKMSSDNIHFCDPQQSTGHLPYYSIK